MYHVKQLELVHVKHYFAYFVKYFYKSEKNVC